MSEGAMHPNRRWREIASQAAKEYDPDKALELAQELIRALDEEMSGQVDNTRATDRAKGAA